MMLNACWYKDIGWDIHPGTVNTTKDNKSQQPFYSVSPRPSHTFKEVNVAAWDNHIYILYIHLFVCIHMYIVILYIFKQMYV